MGGNSRAPPDSPVSRRYAEYPLLWSVWNGMERIGAGWSRIGGGIGADWRGIGRVSIPYWSDFNPIGPTRGSPRAALPQVPWRAPFIKVHGPGIWPRWAGFVRKWEIGAISSRFARRRRAIPGPAEARWAPGFRGRRRARRREILAGPSRPCAHLSSLGVRRPIGVIRGPGSEGQADIGPGSLASLKTTCKSVSARLRMKNFRSSPGPAGRLRAAEPSMSNQESL